MTTSMIWQTISLSSDDTERLGALLGSQLKGGEVIELRSDLGGGKTTFVRGLVRGAGSKDRVTSPTFTLSREYKTTKFDITHYDFYRLTEPGLLADQLAEAINNKNLVIIEWAGLVDNILPNERLSIELKPTASNSDERQLILHYPESMVETLEFIETNWLQTHP